MTGKIETHHDLRVYQKAFQAAMQVFNVSMINHPETWVLGFRDKARPQDEKL